MTFISHSQITIDLETDTMTRKWKGSPKKQRNMTVPGMTMSRLAWEHQTSLEAFHTIPGILQSFSKIILASLSILFLESAFLRTSWFPGHLHVYLCRCCLPSSWGIKSVFFSVKSVKDTSRSSRGLEIIRWRDFEERRRWGRKKDLSNEGMIPSWLFKLNLLDSWRWFSHLFFILKKKWHKVINGRWSCCTFRTGMMTLSVSSWSCRTYCDARVSSRKEGGRRYLFSKKHFQAKKKKLLFKVKRWERS